MTLLWLCGGSPWTGVTPREGCSSCTTFHGVSALSSDVQPPTPSPIAETPYLSSTEELKYLHDARRSVLGGLLLFLDIKAEARCAPAVTRRQDGQARITSLKLKQRYRGETPPPHYQHLLLLRSTTRPYNDRFVCYLLAVLRYFHLKSHS